VARGTIVVLYRILKEKLSASSIDDDVRGGLYMGFIMLKPVPSVPILLGGFFQS
jgi:hypothetical protein